MINKGKGKGDDFKKINLEWVYLSDTPKPQDASTRRRIRSHVTRLQHERDSRSRRAARLERGDEQAVTRAAVTQQAGQSEPGIIQSVDKLQQNQQNLSQKAPAEEPCDVDDSREVGGLISSRITNLTGSPLAKSFSSGAMAARAFLLHDSDNTIGRAISKMGLELPSAMARYDLVVQMQSADFEQNMPLIFARHKFPPGYAYTRFCEFIVTDPALTTETVCLAVHFLAWAQPDKTLGQAEEYQLLRLRTHFITTINAALSDPVRATSDQMITAVALCASYEFKYGSEDAYHMHVAGLIRMITLRGGLAEVGKADPFLEGMLVWQMDNLHSMVGKYDLSWEAWEAVRGTKSEVVGSVRTNGKLFLLDRALEKMRKGSGLVREDLKEG